MLPLSLSFQSLPAALVLSLIASTEVLALAPPYTPNAAPRGLAQAQPASPRSPAANQQRSNFRPPITLPLKKRKARSFVDDEEKGAWARSQGDRLLARYNPASLAARRDLIDMERRSMGSNQITNQELDNSYYGTIAVGSPPIAYDVTLDTGSSDLWLATSGCTLGCDKVTLYNPSNSSSYKNLNKPFSINYGSGGANGGTGSDTVQMAGFEVVGQILGTVTSLTPNLITPPVSGLLGLAWQSLASTNAMPFWQALAGGGVWTNPIMGFSLTRFHNVTNADDEEPGGLFTMGYVNQSLYSGEVEYSAVPKGKQSYWTIPLNYVGVDGRHVVNQTAFAAIDTGTTLIGGPPDAIAAIYAEIPGAYKGTGNYNGYYVYPCATPITLSFMFAGGATGYQTINNGVASTQTAWNVDPNDFMLQKISGTECLGSLFVVDNVNATSGATLNGPDWIIGDTFLKNVFSIFQYNPPAVGFAHLSQAASSLMNDALPSPTIGTNLVTPTLRSGAVVSVVASDALRVWWSMFVAWVCVLVGVFVGGGSVV